MLGLPSGTELNNRISKEKLYANANLTPQLRGLIKNQIESVVWRNKLAESTMGITTGESVKEIQILVVKLRQHSLDRCILPDVSGMFYNSDWLPLKEFTLKLEGLNLDLVYENLARQISGGRLGFTGDIGQDVERDKRRLKLERDIAALEKKVLLERQFNRQVELNGELKRLRKELEGL